MSHGYDLFRPPSEAQSVLLPVTVGCSHNRCRFCGMYRDRRYRVRSWEEIEADLAVASAHEAHRERVFLCDGDALAAPQAVLVRVLAALPRFLPRVGRIATYAGAASIASKSDAELRELRALGLRLVHFGLESGDDATLAALDKACDARSHVEQGRRVRAAGMQLFVTVLLGAGGAERSREHASATADALSALQPEFVGALSLTLVPGTPLHRDEQRGAFALPPVPTLLGELRTLLERTDMRGMFYSNHASNYLPLRARLPRDRAAALDTVDRALQGSIRLRPEWQRGL
jgi:radical SAM superfamily enzyme YgiQ (UPF0313 family)